MDKASQNNMDRSPKELVTPIEAPAPVPANAAKAMIDFCYRLHAGQPYQA